MSNKKIIINGAVVILIVLTVCYIVHLNKKNEALADENRKLREPGSDKWPDVIEIDDIPENFFNEINGDTYNTAADSTTLSFDETIERILHLKKVIEHRDGYKIFYKDGARITREKDVHIMFDLTWPRTDLDVNKEVNNGRGPVDFKISRGKDQTLVELKLASNTKLRMNLQRQVETYADANYNPNKIVVIVYFSAKEEIKVRNLLSELDLYNRKHIILIDARNDNKQSGSLVETEKVLFDEVALN